MRIGNYGWMRAVMTALAMLVLALVVAGCGSKGDDASQTGAGAPAGATGDAAGGAAAEAGKQRNANDVKQEQESISTEPPPVQLQLGDKSGWVVSDATVRVANSQSELSKLAKKVYSNGVKRQQMAPTDFKTRQAVLVQMPKAKAGTQMQIKDVHQDGSKIVVTAIRLDPTKDCPTSGGKVNPFNFVETRKMTGQPTLVVERQDMSC